jgi:hypothetical protein
MILSTYLITTFEELPEKLKIFLGKHQLLKKYQKVEVLVKQNIDSKSLNFELVHIGKNFRIYSLRLDKSNRIYCYKSKNKLKVFSINNHNYKKMKKKFN